MRNVFLRYHWGLDEGHVTCWMPSYLSVISTFDTIATFSYPHTPEDFNFSYNASIMYNLCMFWYSKKSQAEVILTWWPVVCKNDKYPLRTVCIVPALQAHFFKKSPFRRPFTVKWSPSPDFRQNFGRQNFFHSPWQPKWSQLGALSTVLYKIKIKIKHQPNYRNMPTQHIATLFKNRLVVVRS